MSDSREEFEKFYIQYTGYQEGTSFEEASKYDENEPDELWEFWQASRQAVSVPEETLTAIHDTLRLVWSRELSADDGMDEIEILIPPTKADEWIKCSERLPSEADHYLVALSDPEDVGWVTDKAWTAFYNKCGECPEIAVEIVEDGQPVTHWMPLPAPPQEQGQ